MIKKGLWLALFAIAFALVESSVVVYLRALYYPDGFEFPLQLIPADTLEIELFREAATMVLLLSVAWLAGRRFYSRLAWFLIAFGVWDIFYYVWLKILLDWPSSFLSWDLLFLIPLPWVAPVLSPLIVSLTFIICGVGILYLETKNHEARIGVFEWGLLLAGTGLIFETYIHDYAAMLYSSQGCRFAALLECEAFISRSAAYVPTVYNWTLFWLGELLIIAGAYRTVKKITRG